MLPRKRGPRGRTDHRVTAEGRRHLKSGWRELVHRPNSALYYRDFRLELVICRESLPLSRSTPLPKPRWTNWYGRHPIHSTGSCATEPDRFGSRCRQDKSANRCPTADAGSDGEQVAPQLCLQGTGGHQGCTPFRPASKTHQEIVQRVQNRACRQPEHYSRWSVRTLAKDLKLPRSTVHQILADSGLQPIGFAPLPSARIPISKPNCWTLSACI